jgi:transposase
MEWTSVYWIPVYQILEARGLEVCLVNAQHVKNVPGRKTDVSTKLKRKPFAAHNIAFLGRLPNSDFKSVPAENG